MAELSDEKLDILLQDAERRLMTRSPPTLARDGRAAHSGPQSSRPIQAPATRGIEREGNEKETMSLRHVAPRTGGSSATKRETAGPAWFDMPLTHLTPELKRDLQLLRMRSVGVVDPKRFYKKESRRLAVPQYSQMGTVIEGPTEFHSARLNRRERNVTLVDEVMDGERVSGRLKHKALEIARKRASGKKAFYRNLSARRKRG